MALRRHVESVASRERYMGEHLPLSWLAFEASVAALVRQGTDFASLEQVRARRACVQRSLEMNI